jgi:hypothetical protein
MKKGLDENGSRKISFLSYIHLFFSKMSRQHYTCDSEQQWQEGNKWARCRRHTSQADSLRIHFSINSTNIMSDVFYLVPTSKFQFLPSKLISLIKGTISNDNGKSVWGTKKNWFI